MAENRYETILKLCKKKGGIIRTKDVDDKGISRMYLSRMVQRKMLVKTERGIYTLPGVQADDIYILQIKHPQAVFSGMTALYLLGRLPELPNGQLEFYVPHEYNSMQLRQKGVNYIRKSPIDYKTGVITVRTPLGNPVHCYDLEKTICNMLRRRDEEQQAMGRDLLCALWDDGLNRDRLFAYADKLRFRRRLNKQLKILFPTKVS